GVGQLGPGLLDELLVVVADFLRRLAGGEVVVTRVDYDDARLVRRDDAVGVACGVGHLRAAEATVDTGEIGEALGQLPEADAGAADEDVATGLRRCGAVLLLERADGRFPAVGL